MKWREFLSQMQQNTSLARDPNLPDDVTTDKRLRSLRREMRTFQEDDEKRALEAAIMQRKRENAAKVITGDGTNPLKYNGVGMKLKKPPRQTYYGKGGIL